MTLNELVSKLRTGKGIGIAVAVFALGLALVMMPQPSGKTQTEQTEFDYSKYTRVMEQRLTQMISDVSGAGSVSVMVTLESSPEQYYHRDIKTRRTQNDTSVSAEAEESLVFEHEKPILVKEIFPAIKGVAVVCDGARNSQVTQKIIGLVSCALDLSANKIYVTY